FEVNKELYVKSILCPGIGNHDWMNDGTQLFKDQFFLPENGLPDQREIGYSFDYGPLHITLMKHDIVERPMGILWLKKDFGDAQSRGVNFIFTGQHYPIYLDCDQDHELTQEKWKQEMSAIFDLYNVDINWSGHRHCYQRTYPIVSNKINASQWGLATTKEKEAYVDPVGTIYCQNPSLYYQFCNPVNHVQFASNGDIGTSMLGYTEITIEGKKLTAEAYAYSYNGSKSHVLMDHYTISKSPSRAREVKNAPETIFDIIFSNPTKLPILFRLNMQSQSFHNGVINVYNLKGERIARLEHAGSAGTYAKNLYWDGRDFSGKIIPSGIYAFELISNNVRVVKQAAVVN
ncbi:MAG: hypothetical protein ABIA63_10590, partial [bacterium]